ncbi:probable glutathione S-transferase [Hordeum vulgare subsp. vulgare]|uniref:Probable glutathione S-transferase GSTU1 n=1 Tax=Hordeum vulgare subsp. vulgare TaxID=112509 RepID=A0A8I6XFZ1_HORVV|nr:probable glutathione S-transferase [Hordeum vulgare subsp. vulgare]
MADVVLLDFWASPFGQRCRIALAEKGVAYEYCEQDLEQKSELLLRSNPVHKKIPVLLHDGRPVCESLIILSYIDEAWPEVAPLLPRDPYARAQAQFWADYIDNKIVDCQTRLLTTKGDAQEQAKKDMIGALETLEAELGDKDYFGDEAFGFVDVAFVTLTPWFYTYEKYGDFSVEEHCPRIMAWAARCRERESVAKALTDAEKVYEIVQEEYGAN